MIVDSDQPPATHDTSATAAGAARISSAELFHGRRSIVIVHRGQEYRLHITKAGKLILTK
ncbi:MAG TPA: hemin uptake protein HemP [Methylomirabilota bacterium]|jgi:hemin uptake protein HemP|nr:hemin uptake protein HemP [Methylomirabilota bacterium]